MTKTGPIVLLSNHNNALMDALLIATRVGRFSYFLTRASVFKNPKVKRFLKSLNMLPVYRVRDGWSSIQQNNAIFEYCRELLHNGKVVALFPEGNHNIKRTVRPLSKGFTRIVFETLDEYPSIDLKIIPIGLNYKQADAFADSVSMFIGKPLDAQNFNTNKRYDDINNLKDVVSKQLKLLTTHIPHESYNEHLVKLEDNNADFLNPKAVNTCIESNFQACTFARNRKPLFFKSIMKFLMILCLFPVVVIWRYIVKPKIKEIEFVATFRFAMAITLVPIWILLMATVLTLYFGATIALVYVLLSLSFSLLAVKL